MKYCFYYDESEHSRVINLSTVTGETYYDGFLAAIIGWRSDHETAFEQRGNVKKCAVGKHPKSEKLGSTGQAACCARIHSRYFTGGSPSGLRV